MNSVDLIQWPAMAVTVIASWLVASKNARKRNWGFWLFLLSNALWVAWGLHSKAYALIALQLCLVAMNLRGAAKTEDAGPAQREQPIGGPAGSPVRKEA